MLPPKKDRLPLRAALSAGGFFLLSRLILLVPPGRPGTALPEISYYYLMYLAIGAGMLLCFEGSVYEVAYVCVILYLLLRSIQHTRLAVQEADRVREAAEKQQEQYEFKREVIERVNIRAHDLKRLLEHWEKSGRGPDPDMSAQIRWELERYDRLVETGNDALDTVLSDALLRSEQEKVRFSYLLDGKALSFVQPIDLYAVFGNLLDNAFSAVAEIPEQEKRVVSVKMKDTGDCLFFHIFNTCAAAPVLENGLPRTTKPDPENHGFGTKSVRTSVSRYGGELALSAEGGLFHANFFLKKPR